ncbi:MAG TPA: hypothetical protein ENI78_00790 [Euryarchaeota archaeon]|nr:hypothetical protein [Euryarchaeota archaeon]
MEFYPDFCNGAKIDSQKKYIGLKAFVIILKKR